MIKCQHQYPILVSGAILILMSMVFAPIPFSSYTHKIPPPTMCVCGRYMATLLNFYPSLHVRAKGHKLLFSIPSGCCIFLQTGHFRRASGCFVMVWQTSTAIVLSLTFCSFVLSFTVSWKYTRHFFFFDYQSQCLTFEKKFESFFFFFLIAERREH